MDTPSRFSRFAKILYDDINNGCGRRLFTPVEWKAHFFEKHPEHADQLSDYLILAYAQYIVSRDKTKRTL